MIFISMFAEMHISSNRDIEALTAAIGGFHGSNACDCNAIYSNEFVMDGVEICMVHAEKPTFSSCLETFSSFAF